MDFLWCFGVVVIDVFCSGYVVIHWATLAVLWLCIIPYYLRRTGPPKTQRKFTGVGAETALVKLRCMP